MNRWFFAAMLSFVSLPACVRLHAPDRMELGREPMPRADAAVSEAGSSEVDAWIRVMRPRAASEARGICVLLPGILGSHSSPTSEHRLREDGWHVVVVAPPLVSSVLAEMRTGSTDDRVEMGARVGRSVDAVILRAAEATRREIDRVRAAESSLAGKPVILVGESLGALMGVGVAATGLIPCDAALFVAGGGSLVDVAAESSLRRILFGDLPVGDPLFRSGFEAASRFDSLAAARRLRGCPVVCVTAAIDLIVPVRAQEALWTALGEPPRYRFDGGHLELFVFAEWNILPAIRDVAACAGAALPSVP
ncbi:MAG: hypothetical protein RIT24_643 [Planctomycetota bacterium]|jgi:pimeloyl-ACP methyl ester carboxylesterase